MKKKMARIEIRISEEIKNKFQKIAFEKNTSVSKILQDFILNFVKENDYGCND